jgi:outer membrane protein
MGVWITILAAGGCRAPMDRVDVLWERERRVWTANEQRTAAADGSEAASSSSRSSRAGRPIDAEEVLYEESVADVLPEDVLTLDTARSLAVRGNPDVHAALARLQAARARIREQQGRYLPTIAVQHSSTRTFHTPASRNRISLPTQTVSPTLPTDVNEAQDYALTQIVSALARPLVGTPQPRGNTNSFSEHSTGLSLSWVLFDGFVREAQVLTARYRQRASRHALADTRRLILRAIDSAYYQVQLAEEELRIARADVEFSRDQLEVTRKLLDAHRATSADVANFEVRVLGAQAEVKAAEGARETGRVALAELLGMANASLPVPLELDELHEETPALMTPPEADNWVARACAQRPDLQQWGQVMRARAEEVRAAQGLYFPTVNLSTTWGFDRSSTLKYREDDQSSAAAIEMRWELYNGGRRESQIRQAEQARAEAAAVYRRLRLSVMAQVRQAVIDVGIAQEQIRLRRESLATAAENRRLVEQAYRAGKESLLRLNEAQRDYIAADAELARARIRLRQAWSDLAAAAGEHPTNLESIAAHRDREESSPGGPEQPATEGP